MPMSIPSGPQLGPYWKRKDRRGHDQTHARDTRTGLSQKLHLKRGPKRQLLFVNSGTSLGRKPGETELRPITGDGDVFQWILIQRAGGGPRNRQRTFARLSGFLQGAFPTLF